MSIYSKLTSLQNDLKAPKSQRNTFGNYNYRNCEDILSAVKPLLATYKLSLFINDSIAVVGNRYYIVATVTLTDIENPDEKIIVTANAREEESKKGMDGSQVTGASSSYARKYALNGLFAIDDTKDSDGTNDGTHNEEGAKDDDLKAAIKKLANCNTVEELTMFKEVLPDHVIKSKIFQTEGKRRYDAIKAAMA